MADNISIEEHPRYDSKRNAIIGFCREHGGNHNVKVTTYENFQVLEESLATDNIHRATEATVAAIAAFGPKHYALALILLSGTCKREIATNQARLWQDLVNTWYELSNGSALYGDLWNIATDGDATYWLSLHSVFIARSLGSTSLLWPMLSRLRLMNLQCGPHEITINKDFKHKAKSKS